MEISIKNYNPWQILLKIVFEINIERDTMYLGKETQNSQDNKML